MMKKLRLFILCLVIYSIAQKSFAQNVTYSQFDKFDFRSGDFAVAGKVKERLYVYRGSSEGYFLDAYDENMDKLATVVLDFFPKKIYETKFVTYSDHIILLYQSVESNKVVQYAALLDERGRLVKGPLSLDTAKAGMLGPNRTYFSSAVSEDKKHIIVYEAVDKNDDVVFSGKWIDDQLNVESMTSAKFSTDNFVSHGDGIISNSGTFYLPVYTPTGSRQYADQLWLLSIDKGQSAFNKYEVPLNMKYAAGTNMKYDNAKGRMYVSGFYSDKKNGNYEGVLYTHFDVASSTFQNRKNIAFDEQVRTATGERNRKKAFNDYQVRDMIIRNDGGFVLVAESFFITTRNNYNAGFGYYNMNYGNMGASVREYHYNDVVVMSYSDKGIREWMTFIRKDQYSQEDGGLFSSYKLINTGGNLGILYNDFNATLSKVQLGSIDGNGNLTMQSMAAGKVDDPDWLPRSAKQVAAKQIVVPCLRKRQICFAKIVF